MDLRKASDIDQRVVEAVSRRWAGAQNPRILQVQTRFLDGVLYTVGYDHEDHGTVKPFTNRVYVTKYAIEVFGQDEQMNQIVGARHARSFYDVFANNDVVSGVIALMVTLMIVPTFLISYFTTVSVEVPTWITSGWLLILGFYFGKSSGRSD